MPRYVMHSFLICAFLPCPEGASQKTRNRSPLCSNIKNVPEIWPRKRVQSPFLSHSIPFLSLLSFLFRESYSLLGYVGRGVGRRTLARGKRIFDLHIFLKNFISLLFFYAYRLLKSKVLNVSHILNSFSSFVPFFD